MENVVKLEQPDSFEEWWLKYPRPKRVGKAVCRVKYSAIISEAGLHTRTLDRDSGQYVGIHLKATPAELMAGVEQYDNENKDHNSYGYKDGGKYVCHPATWLNQGRWEQ